MISVKKNLLRLLVGLYLLGLIVLGVLLFFENQISEFISISSFHTRNQITEPQKNLISIGYIFEPAELDPVLFDSVTRSYVVDIYEGLTKTDRNLKIIPGIAISWGIIDENNWEFRLRPGVIFHNGTPLTADDVIHSIERALSGEKSELKNLLSNISSIKSGTTPDRIIITTSSPDPLLLNKLALVYIYPKSIQKFDAPIGTGPYKFEQRSDDEIVLKAFDKYWGDPVSYKNAILKGIRKKADRLSALEKNKIQILGNLPPSVACTVNPKYRHTSGCIGLSNQDIEIKSIPSLEVIYLVLNPKHELFKNLDDRKALAMSFNPTDFEDLAFGFARPVNQFVSNGVFGFNPSISFVKYDFSIAKKLYAERFKQLFELPSVTFDYPLGLQTIGDMVKDRFKDLGINVILNPLTDQALLDKILAGQSDLYVLGWRSELGDAIDFLLSAAHSRDPKRNFGKFNGADYTNTTLDKLIETAQTSLDTSVRLENMQQAQKILIDDGYGIPLFETETIYAVRKGVVFEPRVDGYIYVSEVK